MTILTNLSFSANLHTFTKSSFTLACKILHLLETEKRTYKEYASNIYYLSLVRSLLYTTQTQPDIQFAVNLIAQFGGNLGVAHLEAAKCILHYLKDITNFGLVLGRQTKGSFNLVGWTDSN